MAEAAATSESGPAVSRADRRDPPYTLIGEKVGKYKVLREIGRGGMGAVYEALHESLGQRIAIKVLNEGAIRDARHVQRFFDEVREKLQ